MFTSVRSSHQRRSIKKGVLKNFEKFIRKHLYQSLFFNKKETLAQVFSCEFCKNFKNTFFIKLLRTTAPAVPPLITQLNLLKILKEKYEI